MTKQNTQLIHQQPTIAAIATPIGRGGVGVIRLSGATAYQIAKHLTKREHDFTPVMPIFVAFMMIKVWFWTKVCCCILMLLTHSQVKM